MFSLALSAVGAVSRHVRRGVRRVVAARARYLARERVVTFFVAVAATRRRTPAHVARAAPAGVGWCGVSRVHDALVRKSDLSSPRIVAFLPADLALGLGRISLIFWAGPARIDHGRVVPFVWRAEQLSGESRSGLRTCCCAPRLGRSCRSFCRGNALFCFRTEDGECFSKPVCLPPSTSKPCLNGTWSRD